MVSLVQGKCLVMAVMRMLCVVRWGLAVLAFAHLCLVRHPVRVMFVMLMMVRVFCVMGVIVVVMHIRPVDL